MKKKTSVKPATKYAKRNKVSERKWQFCAMIEMGIEKFTPINGGRALANEIETGIVSCDLARLGGILMGA